MTGHLIGSLGSLLPTELERTIETKEEETHEAEGVGALAMDSRKPAAPISKKDFEEFAKEGEEGIGINAFPNDWLGQAVSRVPGGAMDAAPTSSGLGPGPSGKPKKVKQRNQHSGSSTVPKVCGNCGTTSTPLWRKEGGVSMCNACGIYFKNHGYHRPVELIAGQGSRQHSSQGGGRASRLNTPAPSSEAHTDVACGPHQHHHLDTATSQPSNLRLDGRSLRRTSETGGGRGMWTTPERAGVLDTFGPGPPSAPSAMGSDLEGAHEDFLVPGEISDPGGSGEGAARRSGRRRAVRQFGEEWCQPDEAIHPSSTAMAGAARSTLSGGGRSRTCTNAEDSDEPHRQRLRYAADNMPIWAATLPHSPCPSHNGREANTYPNLPQSSLSAEDATAVAAVAVPPARGGPLSSANTFGGFERSGAFAALSSGPGSLLQRCNTPHLPLICLATKTPLSTVVGPLMDEGPDLDISDSAEVVAATLVRLRHRLLSNWMDTETRYGSLAPNIPHDVYDTYSLQSGGAMAGGGFSPGVSPMPSPNPYIRMEYEQEYDPSDSHMSDGATESMRAVASNRRQRQGVSKQRNRGSSLTRASPSRSSAGGGNHECFNCGTSKTPLWRKDRETGETMCNACGIYKQTHGFPRPVDVSMRGDSPSRIPARRMAASGSGTPPGTEMDAHTRSPLRGTGTESPANMSPRSPYPAQHTLPGGASTPPQTANPSPPHQLLSAGVGNMVGVCELQGVKKQVVSRSNVSGKPPLPPIGRPGGPASSTGTTPKPLGGVSALFDDTPSPRGKSLEPTLGGAAAAVAVRAPSASPTQGPREASALMSLPLTVLQGLGVQFPERIAVDRSGAPGTAAIAELLHKAGLLGPRSLMGLAAAGNPSAAAESVAGAESSTIEWLAQQQHLQRIRQLHVLAMQQQQQQQPAAVSSREDQKATFATTGEPKGSVFTHPRLGIHVAPQTASGTSAPRALMGLQSTGHGPHTAGTEKENTTQGDSSSPVSTLVSVIACPEQSPAGAPASSANSHPKMGSPTGAAVVRVAVALGAAADPENFPSASQAKKMQATPNTNTHMTKRPCDQAPT